MSTDERKLQDLTHQLAEALAGVGLHGQIGLEKETLRVGPEGSPALTPRWDPR